MDDFSLLYLADRTHVHDSHPLVGQLTQDGIAEALGKTRANVSRSMAALIRRGLAEEKSVHVRGEARRKTAYFLRAQGIAVARSLRADLEGRAVRVVRGEGREEERLLREVPGIIGRSVPFSTLLLALREGRISLDDVENRLRRGRKALFLGADAVPLPARFLGRDEEVRALHAFLKSPPGFAAAITGIAGIGKSTLARHYVKGLEGVRPVFWRATTPGTEPLRLASDIVAFVARQTYRPLTNLVAASEGRGDRLAQIISSELATVAPLVVLDDLHKSSRPLRDWLRLLLAACRAAGGTQFVLISRTWTDLYDRSAVVREGAVLEVPLRGLPRAAAEEFLRGRVEPGRIGEALRLGAGNPLFLRLVAEGGIGEVAARREVGRFLEEEILRDLRPGELRVLEHAVAFEGAAPVDLLREVGAPRDIASLAARDLLREASPGVFAVHDVVREVVLGSVPQGRLREAHRIAGEYIAERGDLDSVPQGVRHFRLARAPARAAELLIENADALVQAGRAASAAGLGEGLAKSVPAAVRADLWVVEGEIAEATGAWEKALGFYRKAGTTRAPRAVAVSQLGMGRILGRRHQADAAIESLARARDAFERIGDPGLLSETLYFMGRSEVDRGRHEEAQALLERARAVGFSAGDLVREGIALYGLGVLADRRHDYAGAVRIETEAIEILERTGSITDLAKVLTGIAGSMQAAGRPEEALALEHRAIDTARRAGDVYVVTIASLNLAVTLNRLGRLSEAEGPLREALALSTLLGQAVVRARTAIFLGLLEHRAGNRDDALRLWSGAEAAIDETPSAGSKAESLDFLGMTAGDAGERAFAERVLEKALRLAGGVRLAPVVREIEEYLVKLRGSDAP